MKKQWKKQRQLKNNLIGVLLSAPLMAQSALADAPAPEAPPAPIPAASAPASFNVDLGSTTQVGTGEQLGLFSSSVPIDTGTTQRMVAPTDMLTPAELLAAAQVFNTNSQSLVLAAGGNATGGNVNLGLVHPGQIVNLIIPENVVAFHDFNISTLDVAGNLSNFGQLIAVSTGALDAIVNAQSITNAATGSISSILPAAGLPGINGAIGNLNLSLIAANSINNQGIISSAGSLNLVASVIENTGALATMQALNNVSINAASIVNEGTINAQLGSITATAASVVNSGIMQAAQNIQIQSTVNDLMLQTSGVMRAESIVLEALLNNSSAASLLSIQGGNYIGDLFASSAGDITLIDSLNVSGDLTALAEGTIRGTNINLTTSGDGRIILVAGRITTSAPSTCGNCSLPYAVTGTSASGGDIVLTNSNLVTAGALVRMETSGDITVNNITTNGAAGTATAGLNGTAGGDAGHIELLASGNVDTGNLTALGGAGAAGSAGSPIALFDGRLIGNGFNGGTGGGGGAVTIDGHQMSIGTISTTGGAGGAGGNSGVRGSASPGHGGIGGAGGDGGSVVLNSTASLSTGQVDSRGGGAGASGISGGLNAYMTADGGDGGTVEMRALGDITTRAVLTAGGAQGACSRCADIYTGGLSGDINFHSFGNVTANGDLSTGASAANSVGGSVTIAADGRITLQDISTRGEFASGDISLTNSGTGLINTDHLQANNGRQGGSITVFGNGSIDIGNALSGGSQGAGNISLIAADNIETLALTASSSAGDGGRISLVAGTLGGAASTIVTTAIDASSNSNVAGRGGNVLLVNFDGSVQTRAIDASAVRSSGNGGSVSVVSQGAINVYSTSAAANLIDTRSASGSGGGVFLSSGGSLAAINVGSATNTRFDSDSQLTGTGTAIISTSGAPVLLYSAGNARVGSTAPLTPAAVNFSITTGVVATFTPGLAGDNYVFTMNRTGPTVTINGVPQVLAPGVFAPSDLNAGSITISSTDSRLTVPVVVNSVVANSVTSDGSSVVFVTSGSIAVNGGITAIGAPGSRSGDVALLSRAGSITAGEVTTTGGTSATTGLAAGSVEMFASGALTLTGIHANGGIGVAGTNAVVAGAGTTGSRGGAGGNVSLTTISGSITGLNIYANGAAGGDGGDGLGTGAGGNAGSGGNGGAIRIAAGDRNLVAFEEISSYGGQGGIGGDAGANSNSAGDGGNGGNAAPRISLSAGAMQLDILYAKGGRGGDGGNGHAGYGGDGGNSSDAAIVHGAGNVGGLFQTGTQINATGGNGGDGSSGSISFGSGHAGNGASIISIRNTSGSTDLRQLDAYGGAAGYSMGTPGGLFGIGGGSGGDGGDASRLVNLRTSELTLTGSIDAHGGYGAYALNFGGAGGRASAVEIVSQGDVSIDGGVITAGGIGGDSTPGTSPGNGGDGGDGGAFTLRTTGSATMGAQVQTTGGRGGMGGYSTGRGGHGGDGGSVVIEAINQLSTTNIFTFGGGGGGGGMWNGGRGGDGGAGGSISLQSFASGVDVQGNLFASGGNAGGGGTGPAPGRGGDGGGGGNVAVVSLCGDLTITGQINTSGGGGGGGGGSLILPTAGIGGIGGNAGNVFATGRHFTTPVVLAFGGGNGADGIGRSGGGGGGSFSVSPGYGGRAVNNTTAGGAGGGGEPGRPATDSTNAIFTAGTGLAGSRGTNAGTGAAVAGDGSGLGAGLGGGNGTTNLIPIGFSEPVGLHSTTAGDLNAAATVAGLYIVRAENLSGSTDGGILSLSSGNVLLRATKNTSITTRHAVVSIAAGAIVALSTDEFMTQFQTISDRARNSVVVSAGGRSTSLAPGQELSLFSAQQRNCLDAVVSDTLTRRHVEQWQQKEIRAVSSDFCLAQALANHRLLKTIRRCDLPAERRIFNEIEKTASALVVAHIGGNEPYLCGEVYLRRQGRK